MPYCSYLYYVKAAETYNSIVIQEKKGGDKTMAKAKPAAGKGKDKGKGDKSDKGKGKGKACCFNPFQGI